MAKLIKSEILADQWKNDGPKKEIMLSWNGGKIVYFWLKSGQKVAAHTNPGRVIVTVISGRASFIIGDVSGEILNAGESVFYEPGENHGFEAAEDTVLQAVIASDNDVK
jgi:quercetin dioxygenase-like cupin family protein